MELGRTDRGGVLEYLANAATFAMALVGGKET